MLTYTGIQLNNNKKELFKTVSFIFWSKVINNIILFLKYISRGSHLLWLHNILKEIDNTMWWEFLLQNLPTVLLTLIALFFVGAEIIKTIKVWKDKKQEIIDKGVQKQQEELNIQNEFKKLHTRFDDVDTRLGKLESRVENTENQLKGLTESDMHDIKSWIVAQYHKFYNEQGWIDAFSAETIEKRYEDYKREGGNSYIDNLIAQLRSLSMDPTDKKK